MSPDPKQPVSNSTAIEYVLNDIYSQLEKSTPPLTASLNHLRTLREHPKGKITTSLSKEQRSCLIKISTDVNHALISASRALMDLQELTRSVSQKPNEVQDGK